MIVHFIGGPVHGRTEAIQNPQDTYRVAELKAHSIFPAEECKPFAEVPFEEHEYRVTRRTRRYCIAEWRPPVLIGRASVDLRVCLYDSEALIALEQWLFRDDVIKRGSGDVRVVAVSRFDVEQFTLDFEVKVDGPPDAIAVSEVGEKIQYFLDTQMPRAAWEKVTIKQTGVSVDD